MAKSSIIRGASASVGDQALLSLANFLTTVVLARTLSEHGFGYYSLLSTTVVIASGICQSLIFVPIRSVGAGISSAERPDYFAAQRTLLIVLGGAVSVCAAIWFRATYGATALTCVALIAFSMTWFLHEFARAKSAVTFNWPALLRLDTTAYCGRFLLFGLLIAFGEPSIVGFLACIAAAFAGAIVFAATERPQVTFHSARLRAEWNHSWTYGRWLLAETIVFSLSTQMYLYLLAHLRGLEDVGTLNAAQTLMNTFNIVLIGGMNFAVPEARRKLLNYGYEEWRKWLLRVAAIMTGASCSVVLLMTAFGHRLMDAIFGPSYGPQADILPILGVSVVCVSLNAAFTAAFRTSDLPRGALYGKAIASVLFVAAGYWLISSYGLHGAAVGLVLTQIIWLLLNAYHAFVSGSLRRTAVEQRCFR